MTLPALKKVYFEFFIRKQFELTKCKVRVISLFYGITD